jgi:hypothetical protein
MRKIALGLMIVVALAAVSVPAFAGKRGSSSVTGTIELVSTARLAEDQASPAYGEAVGFRTSVSGSLASKSMVYVNVVCLQGSAVVYQASGPQGSPFTMADQDGQGLEWDGGAADCVGALVYRVEQGKNVTISYLAHEDFAVAAG